MSFERFGRWAPSLKHYAGPSDAAVMRRALFAAALLASLAVPIALAAPPIAPRVELGTHAGTLTQGASTAFSYSSGGDPCLGVYIPHTYVVNLAYAPIDDTLTVSSHGVSASGSNGLATISFVDNWCTTFGVRVDGTEVAGIAAFVVNIRDAGEVLALGGPAIA